MLETVIGYPKLWVFMRTDQEKIQFGTMRCRMLSPEAQIETDAIGIELLFFLTFKGDWSAIVSCSGMLEYGHEKASAEGLKSSKLLNLDCVNRLRLLKQHSRTTANMSFANSMIYRMHKNSTLLFPTIVCAYLRAEF